LLTDCLQRFDGYAEPDSFALPRSTPAGDAGRRHQTSTRATPVWIQFQRSAQGAARVVGILRIRMWSNGRVFVRIWEYEAPEAHLDEFRLAYQSLDIQLEGLCSSERSLFEGNS
jgi:hypothetical protein